MPERTLVAHLLLSHQVAGCRQLCAQPLHVLGGVDVVALQCPTACTASKRSSLSSCECLRDEAQKYWSGGRNTQSCFVRKWGKPGKLFSQKEILALVGKKIQM